MTEPRTPREAKQQLLDDLIAAWKHKPFSYSLDMTPKGMVDIFLAHNRRTVTEVAKKHGLKVPKFTPDFGTELSS